MKKKAYQQPKLNCYGSVEQITQARIGLMMDSMGFVRRPS